MYLWKGMTLISDLKQITLLLNINANESVVTDGDT
jgi:hypothetical protein